MPRASNGKMPAIFAHHQHNREFQWGKSEVAGLAGDPNQAYAAELAERGYVVLAPDALAFEERNWSFPDGQAEYFELATRLVKGRTLLAKCLHDVSAGVSFLSSLSEVDPGRIGFIGHSYGGRMAIWAAAHDERIRAAVSNCGCVNYKNSLTHDTGIQMEFCLPGVLLHGDVEDIVRMVAPRALLLQAAAEDRWSRGAEPMYQYARSAFPEDKLELSLWPGDHVFSIEMRRNAYRFLAKHLATT
jgi:dienelactone hydrolase